MPAGNATSTAFAVWEVNAADDTSMSPGKIILFIKCILVPLNVKLLEFTVVVIFAGKVALANLKLSMLIFMSTAASEAQTMLYPDLASSKSVSTLPVPSWINSLIGHVLVIQPAVFKPSEGAMLVISQT